MRTLWIGDDLLVGIAQRVTDLTREAKDEAIICAHSGSYTEWWSRSGAISSLVRQHKPSVIIFALAENDADHVDIKSVAKTIIRDTGHIPVVWLGPTKHGECRHQKYKTIRWVRFVDLCDLWVPGGAFGHLLAVDRYGAIADEVYRRATSAAKRSRWWRWAIYGGVGSGMAAGAHQAGIALGWW